MGLEEISHLYSAHAHSKGGILSISKTKLSENVIREITENQYQNINPTLRDTYSKNFNSAIKGVFGSPTYGNVDFDLATQASIEMERLAHYKSYHATQLIKSLDVNSPEFDKNARAIINTYDRYQDTEYNTIVARARSAQQWNGFEDRKALFPNLQWLPSRSAEPRAEHMSFYYRIWPIDDPFWDNHQPGAAWGCKCDWIETDTPVTDNTELDSVKTPKGLSGNPGKTGKLISEDHPYFSKTSKKVQKEIEGTVTESIRTQAREKANKLVDKIVGNTIDGNNIQIKISQEGLTNVLNASVKNTNFKNAIVPYFDRVIESSTWVKSTSDHAFFKIKVLKDIMHLDIINKNGVYTLYSIIDNAQ